MFTWNTNQNVKQKTNCRSQMLLSGESLATPEVTVVFTTATVTTISLSTSYTGCSGLLLSITVYCQKVTRCVLI